MGRLGIEVKDPQALGLVAKIGKAFDVPVHGRGKAGDVDYAFWVPGGNHLWHCLVQANPRGIDNHGVHFGDLGVPLLHR